MMLYLLVGPSGIGKTTIINLLKKQHSWSVIPTYTTRSLREDEREGETDRIFVREDDFRIKLETGKIYSEFEYEGNLYGESTSHIRKSTRDKYEKWCLDISFYKIDLFGISNVRTILLLIHREQLEIQLESCGRASRKEQAFRELGHCQQKAIENRNRADLKTFEIVPNFPNKTADLIENWHMETQ